MRDALVSIAAGASQLPLLRTARRMGLAVIAVDRDPNAPGFRVADARLVASTHAAPAILAGLERLARTAPELRPCAVATKSSGPPVATAAEVARALGLAGLHPTRARMLVSKPGQVKLATLAGLRVPRHCAPPSLDQLRGTDLALPLVVKPAVTRVGKAGIALVRSEDELEQRFAEARAASLDGRVQCEAFVPGADLACLALFRGSRVFASATLDEDTRFLADGSVRGFGSSAPARAAGTRMEQAVRDAAARFVSQLELGDGSGLFTFRVAEEAEPALLELHLDLAGDRVTDVLLPRALGLDPIEALLRTLLGEEPALPAPAHAVAVRFLFGADRARVGAQALEELGGRAEDFALSDAAAQADPASCIGHLLLEAPDAEALARASAALDRDLGRAS